MTDSTVKLTDLDAAAGDGNSHPLGQQYATLQDHLNAWDALMVSMGRPSGSVPSPVITWRDNPNQNWGNVERGWVAAQGASDFAYGRDDMLNNDPNNQSCADILVDGRYIIDGDAATVARGAALSYNHLGIKVRGITAPTRFGLASSSAFIYKGPAGTIDKPIAIIDLYGFTESLQAPPNRKATGDSGGIRPEVEHITFYNGVGSPSMGNPGETVDLSKFITAIRLRKSSYARVAWCNFAGTLWDGAKFTDAQLFPIVEYNNFYGVHRDAIAFDLGPNFSTTEKLNKNEFAFVGRYAILMDHSGGVEASAVIQDNDFEHAYSDSFFVKHPEWFVQGVVAGACMINVEMLEWGFNRTEGVILTQGYHAELHLTGGCDKANVHGGSLHNLAMTSFPGNAPERTPALIAYKQANGHTDITDTRNYALGTSTDHTDNEGLHIADCLNLLNILVADGVGLSSSNTHRFEGIGATYQSMSIADRPNVPGVKMVAPIGQCVPTLMVIPGNVRLLETILTTAYEGPRDYGNFSTFTGSGDYMLHEGAWAFGVWQPNHQMSSLFNTAAGSPYRCPTVGNGRTYQAMTSGQTGATEPTWPVNLGDTVQDGGVTWQCIGLCAFPSEEAIREWMTGSLQNRMLFAEGGTPPPLNTVSMGDGGKYWLRTPDPGGPIGYVIAGDNQWHAFGGPI